MVRRKEDAVKFRDKPKVFTLPETELKDEKEFCQVQELRTKRVYEYYKKNKKSNQTLTEHKFFKFIDALFKLVNKKMVSNEAGVFLERLGYFYIIRMPKRRIKAQAISPTNIGISFRPMFVPIRYDSKLEKYIMDYGFPNAILVRIARKKKKFEEPYSSSLKMLLSVYTNQTNLTTPELRNVNN